MQYNFYLLKLLLLLTVFVFPQYALSQCAGCKAQSKYIQEGRYQNQPISQNKLLVSPKYPYSSQAGGFEEPNNNESLQKVDPSKPKILLFGLTLEQLTYSFRQEVKGSEILEFPAFNNQMVRKVAAQEKPSAVLVRHDSGKVYEYMPTGELIQEIPIQDPMLSKMQDAENIPIHSSIPHHPPGFDPNYHPPFPHPYVPRFIPQHPNQANAYNHMHSHSMAMGNNPHNARFQQQQQFLSAANFGQRPANQILPGQGFKTPINTTLPRNLINHTASIFQNISIPLWYDNIYRGNNSANGNRFFSNVFGAYEVGDNAGFPNRLALRADTAANSRATGLPWVNMAAGTVANLADRGLEEVSARSVLPNYGFNAFPQQAYAQDPYTNPYYVSPYSYPQPNPY
ncbi:MAG TPA: hypothetical protein V6C96_02820 [Vampirovibrionales bacterium]